MCYLYFFSSRRRHTRLQGDWSSDVCSSDLRAERAVGRGSPHDHRGRRVQADQVVIGGGPGDRRSEERRVGKEWGYRRTGADVVKRTEWGEEGATGSSSDVAQEEGDEREYSH